MNGWLMTVGKLFGFRLNPSIRIRDQVRFPTVVGGRAVFKDCAEEKGHHFFYITMLRKHTAECPRSEPSRVDRLVGPLVL